MICWIRDFEVKSLHPCNHSLDGIAGAFVAIVGLAENQGEFVAAAKRELTEAGLAIAAIAEAEPLLDRSGRAKVADYLLRAAEGLDRNCRIFVGHLEAWGH